MFSRTYDAQRFSPLKQITKQNVGQLQMAWTRGLGAGQTETIPIVHNGVMYLVAPGGDRAGSRRHERRSPLGIQAQPSQLTSAPQARTSRWRSIRTSCSTPRPMLVVGLDARTGEQRWETKTDDRGNTSGPYRRRGQSITGGACAGNRDNCFIAAHDALTGKEVWRFYTTPAPGEPGDESWGGADVENRRPPPGDCPALTTPPAS